MVEPDIRVEWVVKNPYVGPKPFESHEQNLFFGREWETEQLAALVMAHPAVLLYAQSGAGKSSLLNAKVIPTLELKEGCEVLPVARVRGDIPPAVQVEQIKNRYVFNTLMSWIEASELEPARLVDCTMAQFLQWLPRRGDDEGYPALRVLVFDQFEELFTFYPERWPEREQFFQQVNEVLAADSFLRVLFVIREDYLAQLDAYSGQLPEQLRSRFWLERLTGEAALAAIEKPLQGTVRSFALGVAQELVDELLKIRVEGPGEQMIERPGEFVEPVQLQVVCQSLWAELPPDVTQITSEHLRTFGNVDQALTRFYEKAIQETVAAVADIPLYSEWRLRNWFEEETITPAGTRSLVYQGPRKTGSISNEEVYILETRHHIIRGERRAGGRWYELTHDRFIRPIQKANAAWRMGLLRKWAKIIGMAIAAIILILFGITITQRFTAPTIEQLIAANKTAQAEAKRAEAAEATVTAAATQVSATGTAVAEVEATSTAAVEEVIATTTVAAQAIRKERVRPLRAGLSIGGQNATAGTLGYFVVDDEGQIYILSASDVLGSVLGNLVLQPGLFDGGQIPDDGVGRLSKRLPLTDQTVPITNLTALAALNSDIEIEAAVPGNGPILGVHAPEEGMKVRKLGRSTGWTEGEIKLVDQTVPIAVSSNQTIQVQGAIRATLESSPGDAGALVVDEDGYAVGLLVAASGSGREAYLVPIQAILDSFNVHLLTPTIRIQDISRTLPQHPIRRYPPRHLTEINRIVIHHTVTTATLQSIAAFLVNNRDRPGIPYHYCVTDQGGVYQTQPLDVITSEATQFGSESIDLCLVGDFTDHPPSPAQLNAAAVLITQLALDFDLSLDQIFGHKELAPTQSPGATWEQWKGDLLAKVRDLMKSGVSTTIVSQEAGH